MKYYASIVLFFVSAAVAEAELRPLDDSGLSGVTGRSGMTIDVVTNAESNIYYLDIDSGATAIGGGVLLEGVQIVSTNPATGEITSTPSVMSVEVDVTDSPGLSIQTSFPANTAVKIDAVRLAPTARVTGETGGILQYDANNESFENALVNLNGCTGCGGGGVNIPQASSLGAINLTGVTGTAQITVRAK